MQMKNITRDMPLLERYTVDSKARAPLCAEMAKTLCMTEYTERFQAETPMEHRRAKFHPIT